MTALICQDCTHGAAALPEADLPALLALVPAWRAEAGALLRTYAFSDWPETLAFVTALGWMAHRQDHHPRLTVEYRRCTVAWTTHSAGNRLSRNDFICAARADALYDKAPA